MRNTDLAPIEKATKRTVVRLQRDGFTALEVNALAHGAREEWRCGATWFRPRRSRRRGRSRSRDAGRNVAPDISADRR